MFASVIFVTQKEFPVAKPLTFEMRTTTRTVISTAVDKRRVSYDTRPEIVRRAAFINTRQINDLFPGSVDRSLLFMHYW